MAHKLVNRAFYEAIVDFYDCEDARDYYYQVMDTKTGNTGKNGREETVRDQIRRLQPGIREILETTAGATVTTHCGPETLGILFVRQGVGYNAQKEDNQAEIT